MNRQELDDFATHYRLSTTGADKLLAYANAYPARDEVKRFARFVLQIGGVLSLCASVIFFIAANWDALGIVGHFALIQGLLAACIVTALVRPPPQRIGRYSLFLAFVATGALLALFGQTYQTGADTYELFLTWSVLALPLVIAGQWSVTWAAWLIVLNTGFALFSGWIPGRGALWIVFANWGFNESLALLLPAAFNLIVWGIAECSTAAYLRANFPSWVRRIAIVAAVGFVTWSGIYAIVADSRHYGASSPEQTLITWILLIAALAIPAGLAIRARRDVLPLAAISGSIIVLGAVLLAKVVRYKDVELLFYEALWLVSSSTLIGRWLTHLHRDWRAATAQESLK